MAKPLHISTVLAALVTAVATAAPLPDTLPVDIPSGTHRARKVAYLGASMVAIQPAEERVDWGALLGRDPFRTDGHRVLLDLTALDAVTAQGFVEAAAATEPVGRLSFKEFRSAGEVAYLRTRDFPETTADLHEEIGLEHAGHRWHSVILNSLINRGTRRIFFRADEVLGRALDVFAAGEEPHFPVGSTFLAEELQDGVVTETHVLRKRADRYWDFALYDHDGRRALFSPAFPKRFRAPMTCASCHQNSMRFPPFREFPEASPPVGDFLPRVEMELTADEAVLVAAFPKGPRAPDRILGSYAGLAAVGLLRAAEQRPLLPWELALVRRLVELGLVSSPAL